jgi:DNA-binding transcriptional activator of the SARP family
MGELRIWLLGGFRVAVDGLAIAGSQWRLRKAGAVLKLLALAPGHRLLREQAIDHLWPELNGRAADNQLRKALHELRRVLDPDPGSTYRFLEPGDPLRLRRELTWVDVDAFESAVAEARRSQDPQAYQSAVSLYGGHLLPEDRYEEWAIVREGALRSEFQSLQVELASLLEARADVDGAAAALRRVISDDPLHEDASAALMRVYALGGRRHDALAEYDRLQAAMARELGTEPDAATQRLREQIRVGYSFDPQLTRALWEQVGDLRLLSGDATGATAAFSSALESLRGSAADRVGARLHRKAAQAALMLYRTEAAEAHLHAATTLLVAEPDQAESGRLLGVRASLLWERGRLEDAQAAAEASLSTAEHCGDAEDIAASNETLAIVFHMRGAWRSGLHVEIDRVASRADTDVQLARVFDIHHCIGQYHLYGDGLSRSVEDYARRTLDLAIARNARRAQAFSWCLLGESLLLQGRWDEALGCLEQSAGIHSDLGTRSGTLPWQRLAELASGRGDSDTAARCLRQGMAIATISPLARHAWGRLYATVAFDAIERGDPEDAVKAVRAAAAAAARTGGCPTCAVLLNPMAAEAYAMLGDEAGASAHARAAEQVAATFTSRAWRAMAECSSGSSAAARGDGTTARDHFLVAAQLYGAANQPFWEARSTLQAATAAPGDDVDGLAAAAAATFDRIGAARAAQRAHGLRRAVS